MVEFAMVFMLLFILITLIAEGGFLFSTWLAATNGAREGARFAAPCLNRDPNPCFRYPTGYPDSSTGSRNVYDRVVDYTKGFLDQSPGRFQVTVASTVDEVKVTVKATVSSVTPILGDLQVYGQSTMRLETSPN